MARDNENDDWLFGKFFAGGFGPRAWAFCWPEVACPAPGGRRWRQQIFESGEVKYVILRLLKEKPLARLRGDQGARGEAGRLVHALGGDDLPTLQLLEDQGFVRAVETEGKKVYHITPEGEAFLEQHRDVLDEILERVGGAVRGFAGGAMGELSEAFARLARLAFVEAWRSGPGDPKVQKILEILEEGGGGDRGRQGERRLTA